jgi:ribosomal protein S18 acetylase RimI-like enzyme
MVEHAVAYLESIGCRCQKLDATEAGARVYEKMGFTIEYEVQRWLGSGRGGSGGGAGFPDLALLSAAELNQLDALDATAFGASRRKLLQWYCTNDSPRFLAGDPLRPAGYVVGRPGSPAWQMGPLVAVTRRAAEQLMTAFLHSLPQRPVIADVVTVNQTALRLLRDFGFTRQRVLQRMYRGENAWPGRPEETFSLAGFEYG